MEVIFITKPLKLVNLDSLSFNGLFFKINSIISKGEGFNKSKETTERVKALNHKNRGCKQ